MKKVAIILLTCIYSLSVLGINLKAFYCCGKLKTITLSLANVHSDKCGKGDNKTGCCKTKSQYLKVKDNHLATGDFTIPIKYHIELASFDLPYQVNAFISDETKVINGSHAPPLHSGIPIYISNCVFRI